MHTSHLIAPPQSSGFSDCGGASLGRHTSQITFGVHHDEFFRGYQCFSRWLCNNVSRPVLSEQLDAEIDRINCGTSTQNVQRKRVRGSPMHKRIDCMTDISIGKMLVDILIPPPRQDTCCDSSSHYRCDSPIANNTKKLKTECSVSSFWLCEGEVGSSFRGSEPCAIGSV